MPVPGYVAPPISTPAQDNFTASFGPTSDTSARNILFDGGPQGGLTEGLVNSAGGLVRGLASPSQLSPDAANAQYGIPGQLSFSHPVSAGEAQWRQDTKRNELYRSDILSRADGVNGAERIADGLVGGLADPVSFGMNFIPFLGEANDARQLGLGARLLHGAWVGGKVGAAQAGLEYGLDAYQGIDDTPADAGTQILSSAVFGSAFEGVGYAAQRVFGGKSLRLSPSQADVATRMQALLTQGGVPEPVARGIVAGGYAENGLNPGAVNPKSGASFWGQWLGPRKAAIEAQFGPRPTLEQQAEFVLGELHGGDPGGPAVLAAKTSEEAAQAYITHYMRPAAGMETQGDLERASRYLGSDVSAGEAVPGPSPAYPPVPDAVSAMDEIDRAGVAAKAIDDMARHSQVDVGDLVEQAIAHPRADVSLNEASADPQIAARQYHDDVATTARGSEIGVRYALVEGADLKATHDIDGVRNQDYPPELAPKDRTAVQANADLKGIVRTFDPNRLIDGSGANEGAPIVSPDGTVESGHLRLRALARLARDEAPGYAKYTEALNRAGYDTSGMTAPVLVRMRTAALDGPERVRLSREANARPAPEGTPAPPADGRAVSPQVGRVMKRARGDGVPVEAQVAPVAGGRVLGGQDLPGAIKMAPAPEIAAPEASQGVSGRAALLARLAKADPEIAELARDLARLEATDAEVAPELAPVDNPENLAKAIEAFSACLIKGV